MVSDAYGMTDTGRRRTNNEDAFTVSLEKGFFALADGMGGAAAGEVASRIFVETAGEVFERAGGASGLDDKVKQAFLLANDRILRHARAHPECAGMGCTAEILAVGSEGVVIGHVGDSRTYHLRSGALRRITVDHSLVHDQVARGLITEQEARIHPMRHVILRAVGTAPDLQVDIITGRAAPGDIFLLCSDGLTDMMPDDEILSCMSQDASLRNMAERLIEGANQAGGKDNITVVLVRMG